MILPFCCAITLSCFIKSHSNILDETVLNLCTYLMDIVTFSVFSYTNELYT